MSDYEDIVGFSIEEEEFILEQRYRNARKGGKKRPQAVGTPLNINSMMDLMFLILVFLMLTSISQDIRPSMSEELSMVWSTADKSLADTITITVTRSGVLVNDDLAVHVEDGNIPDSARLSLTSPIIPDLQAKVESIVRVEERWEETLNSGEGDRIATIIADHRTSYELLTYVMMTASAGGIDTFKFAILNVARPDVFNNDVDI